jgi:hypothetical protein
MDVQMKTPSDIIHAELGGVSDVVNLVCKVEELRRGVAVDRHDNEVQLLAAEIILNGVGADLRERCDLDTKPNQGRTPVGGN